MATPTSTYRLQIRASLTLDDAAGLVDYLAELGVDAVYCSPLLTATCGSDHGYDVTDVTQVDPERGGERGWTHFVAAARGAGLKIVVDIVPNHLGIGAPEQNPSWWSVLRDGRGSPYAGWYDIDWSQPISVPILASGDADDDLDVVDGGLRYFEHRFPLAPGSYRAGDSAAEVHRRQHYRLIHWRRANTDLSYRRFFAVNTLAGLRVEDPEVFEATHARILRWVNEDHIDGLRVDHPDGLVDPTGYFHQLREAAPDTWMVVEKILEPGEELPSEWPVQGTTGYDAMTEVCQLFVATGAAHRFTSGYAELTGDAGSAHDQIVAGKTKVARELFTAEVQRIIGSLDDTVAGVPRVADALRAVAVAFEVYRSYLPLAADTLDAAIDRVRTREADLGPALDALTGPLHEPAGEVARRFQQLTGPVMAKGVEDTAWYRYNRFVALNEVGGDPDRFGLDVEGFHQAQAARQVALAESMTSLSTHDTKRGEDVRARLAALAEVPDAWTSYVRDFLTHTAIPGPGFGYLLAQTFAGVGLIGRDRMHAYAEKAIREAALGTSWDEPDPEFERAVHDAVDGGYDNDALHDQLGKLITIIKPAGWVNSLGQKLIQLTMPGIPDVYQGTERWEDSLVDPDNRRRIDFADNAALLRSMTSAPPVDDSGAAKLWLTRNALRLRRDHPELFTGYAPVRATGAAHDHLVAFDRGGAITVATRLPITLADAGGWGDTTIDLDGRWTDELSGRECSGTVMISTLFGRLPVALLRRMT